MPFVINPVDGVKIYFEDDGGNGQPVVFYAGLTQPIKTSRASGIAIALKDEFRLIFADHRGHGHSDKPHNVEAYHLLTRVTDATAMLDELGIERAHFIGFSWGARLGFAIGEYAPQRVLSLVLCGNQPYAWNPNWKIMQQFSAGLPVLDRNDMAGAINTWESWIDGRFREPERTFMLDNDPIAIAAAWRSTQEEEPISTDLTKWQIPCFIYVGETDDMHDNAQRAGSEIPNATFLSLAGYDHFSAAREVDQVIPHILNQLSIDIPN
ncbi:alpha/beta fold hydrolase [Chloroflexota bacterium]